MSASRRHKSFRRSGLNRAEKGRRRGREYTNRACRNRMEGRRADHIVVQYRTDICSETIFQKVFRSDRAHEFTAFRGNNCLSSINLGYNPPSSILGVQSRGYNAGRPLKFSVPTIPGRERGREPFISLITCQHRPASTCLFYFPWPR